MKRLKYFLPVLLLALLAGYSEAVMWKATCTFGVNDNVCYVDTREYQDRGHGNVNIFIPAATGRAGKTLTVTLSHDNTTFYTAYVENGDTVADTYPGDNTVNKVYGLDPAYAARYWKISTTDNTFNSAVIYIQGTY